MEFKKEARLVVKFEVRTEEGSKKMEQEILLLLQVDDNKCGKKPNLFIFNAEYWSTVEKKKKWSTINLCCKTMIQLP